MRQVLAPFKVVSAGSMAADIVSTVVNVEGLDQFSIFLVSSGAGAPVGAVSVEVSNDYRLGDPSVGHWTTLPIADALGLTPRFSGADDTVYVDLRQLSSPWLRVRYTRISGTGTLDVIVSGKKLGG